MKIGVILGSVRQGRMADRVGKLIMSGIEARGHHPKLFDPMVEALPLLEKPLHFHGPSDPKPENLVRLHQELKDQDAFVIVSAEYNFGVPPPLSNFIDHFPYDCWARKPGAIVTYSMGNFGGIVAGTQLRTMASVFSLIMLPAGLTIPNVQFQIEEDGKLQGERVDSINKNMNKMLDELVFVGEALSNHKLAVA